MGMHMTTDLLDIAIKQLDFNNGQMFDLSSDIKPLNQDDWLNKSDWLASARKAGAESIFFVANNPVVVFARSTKSAPAKIEAFNKLWCLSRPRLLFLESEGELSVIDLAQAPIRHRGNDIGENLKTLETLTAIKDVSQRLQIFHRDNIESGKVFEHDRFGSLKYRADQALISDLKTVRKRLMDEDLCSSSAHALIGRSIFIRYLEDRSILTGDYFLKVAGSNSKWRSLLSSPCSRENLDFSGIHAMYPRVLQDKSFTFALYRSLAADFNGDMFPNIEKEEQQVESRHLELIQSFIYGDVEAQEKLFFFSYKFDIIPLDLISAIYEEFYHASTKKEDKKNKARQDGAYYTPPALAEFVLSRVLTVDVLKQNPRVMDPACGSGIFLVEAFRRMVRFHISQKGFPPSFAHLKELLGRHIVGIEVNEEAARIAAFSLYLAMLHYLDPPSILEYIKKGNRLPNLIASKEESPNHYNSIHVANAFSLDNDVIGNVDVVVGNPPWGAPGKNADKTQKHASALCWIGVKRRNTL